MAFQQTLSSKVVLTFSCKGLKDRDVTSKSDPIIQVLMEDSRRQTWKEIGRTESLKNSNNPEFSKSVEVEYRFEEVQNMKFCVYDVDNATLALSDDDFLGKLECTLAQIVSSKYFTKHLVYKGKANDVGTITIIAEERSASRTEVSLLLEGQHLDNKDFLSKSDPYLEIYKIDMQGRTSIVHRTEYINDTLNPKWAKFAIPTQRLCNNNYDVRLKFRCFDYDDDGSHDLIGEFSTTLNQMLADTGSTKQWECINQKKQAKKKGYKNSGVIILREIKVMQSASFLDFVMSGCQINFTVGIDFTASNGDPTNETSLHYLSPEPNQYLRALTAVGQICQDYDTDKMFPALGFGAKIPPSWQVSFEFPLNFNLNNPYCAGIDGVIQAYQTCVRQIQLYGPTNVAPIINHIGKFAYNMIRGEQNLAKNYFILLLLTDGVISDMQETVDAVVEASYLPISLIIVGVGNAVFTQMDFLDCDQGRLRARNGKSAMRDIVQFVPYRDYQYEPPQELARVVLAEVPKQVEEYFKLMGIMPMASQQHQVPLQMPHISS